MKDACCTTMCDLTMHPKRKIGLFLLDKKLEGSDNASSRTPADQMSISSCFSFRAAGFDGGSRASRHLLTLAGVRPTIFPTTADVKDCFHGAKVDGPVRATFSVNASLVFPAPSLLSSLGNS